MKYLLTGMIALTLLTGCGQKDKLAGGGAPASVVFNANDLPDVTVRKGDSATAGAALSVLSLAESGSGRLSFADSDIKGDRAEFSNITLSAPELAGEGSPASPSDAELAEIFAFMDTDGDGVADDGSGMTLDDLRADMQVPASAPSPAPVVKAAKLEFDGLGMFDGKANFGLMKLSDVTITPAEGSEDQSTGKINSIELVNPSPETAAWVASLLGKGELAPANDGIEQARIQRDAAQLALEEANREGELLSGAAKLDHNKKTLELVDALADANQDYEMAKAGNGPAANSFPKLSFDRFLINGVNFNVADASGTGLFTVDSLHISDLKEEKAGLIGLSNLKFDFAEAAGSDVKISLEGFGVKGINYGLFSEALSAGAGSSTNPAGLTSAIQADPANPGYDALALKALKADIVGASVDLASLTSAVSRDKQGRATKIVTDPFSLTVAARDNPDGEQFAGALATMGYEKLTFSGAGESLYDPDADIVTLAKGKNYWKLNDGFKLDFSAKYAGTKALAAAQAASLDENADPEAMITSVMENVVVHQLEFALDDDGIVDRALNAYAAQSGEDPAAVRGQISGMFAMAPMFAASTGIDTAVVSELATALSSFVTAPKTLTISLAPPTPVKAQAFVDAASDPSKKLTKAALGFSASNK